MDGLLVVDKPVGPTSHDVVARVRRVLGERRVGHTGTLDPMASGVLPLVVGRATRLAQFLSADDKTYEATIRLGVSTDTYDATGRPVGVGWSGPLPTRAAIEAALDRFRGSFEQQPPAFSAKKIGGRRSYELARRGGGASAPSTAGVETAVLPAPVMVTTYAIDLLEASDEVVRLRVSCSAGFYVRSLAHDLGTALGTGAHLTALRRTASGGATISEAVPLERLEADNRVASAALIPMERMLAGLPVVALTPEAVNRARCGRELGSSDATDGLAQALEATRTAPSGHVRLLDPAGHLVGLATRSQTPGFLHPAVILM